MNIYIVGGFVRDLFLNRKSNDIDYLVVGATKDKFLNEFPNAELVGNSFPVFLLDGEEYAFARTERKDGEGHKGFSVDFNSGISVEDDLARRDLTINAIAMCPETGNVVDPFGGLLDLKNRILKHTTEFFQEDPLRVFRVARFASQMPSFSVHSDTISLMSKMAKRGDLKTLSAERVWKETEKALSTKNASIYFNILKDAECLDDWFPELKALIGISAGAETTKHKDEVDTFHHSMIVLDRTFGVPETKFAALLHDVGKALSEEPPKHPGHDEAGILLIENFCKRLKVPNRFRDSALVFCKEHIRMHKVFEMKSGKAVRMMEEANKRFHGGLKEFLKCSIGDGTSIEEAEFIFNGFSRINNIKLPKEYYDRGESCKQILLNIRALEWKKEKRKWQV